MITPFPKDFLNPSIDWMGNYLEKSIRLCPEKIKYLSMIMDNRLIQSLHCYSLLVAGRPPPPPTNHINSVSVKWQQRWYGSHLHLYIINNYTTNIANWFVLKKKCWQRFAKWHHHNDKWRRFRLIKEISERRFGLSSGKWEVF